MNLQILGEFLYKYIGCYSSYYYYSNLHKFLSDYQGKKLD